MITTPFSTVLRGASALLDGHDITQIETEDFRLFRDTIRRHLKRGWEFAAWPELTKYELRRFRPAWAVATAYTATTEVYHIASEKYFQALRASTGEEPADSLDVENSAYWAECKRSYNGDDYSASTAYVAGDQVFYPTTGEFYQCHTASTGNVPTNTTYWGLLTPFDRTIDYAQTGETEIGHVFGVWEEHPLRIRNASRVDYALGCDEFTVLKDLTEVWVEFCEPAPLLDGDVFSATATYSVGNKIYWDNSGAIDGDFYECLSGTSAGEDPTDTPAKWSKLEIPLFLENYLVHAAYKELARIYNRDPDIPVRLFNEPQDHLADELLKLAKQRQHRNPYVTQRR